MISVEFFSTPCPFQVRAIAMISSVAVANVFLGTGSAMGVLIVEMPVMNRDAVCI